MSEIGKAPPSKIDIQVDDKTQTVFMSFALLNLLTPMVGGPERIGEFDFDAQVRELAVIYCVAPRDENKKIPEGYTLPELDIDQTETLLDWVKGHVLSFFIRRLMSNIKIIEENAEVMKKAQKVMPPQTN